MMDQKALNTTGFYVDVDRVKGLPILESVAVEVVFNPTSSNVTIGPLECRLPIKVRHRVDLDFYIRVFYFVQPLAHHFIVQ